MVVTYHIKIFRKGTDRHNDILSLLLLVAETIKPPSIQILKIKIIEENLEIFDNFLCINMNNFFKSSLFPSCKMANVTPLHKKGMKDLHENYWPVTILPILSKVFETSMFAQMFSFVLQLFCQNNNVPSGMAIVQRLLALLEKWKRPVDSGQIFGASLTDLSKVFICLEHGRLLAKLNAYRFSLPTLKLAHDHLSDRK